jgi:hypothetical protein
MSEIGAKSWASAAEAASTTASLHGRPTSAASVSTARFGIAAMPPKAIRAAATRPSSTVMLKAPSSAEMSWSNRLETLWQRRRSG